MKVIEGGVTAPKGFQAAGIFAGIKKDKKDMAMVYSEVPCVVAGTFTTNVVKAAPVKWDQHVVYEVGKASAIVANSGIANACTGEEGYGYCRETAAKTAELLHVSLHVPTQSHACSLNLACCWAVYGFSRRVEHSAREVFRPACVYEA